MKLTRSTHPDRFQVAVYALALSVTLLSAIIRAQAAEGRRAGTTGSSGTVLVITPQTQIGCVSFPHSTWMGTTSIVATMMGAHSDESFQDNRNNTTAADDQSGNTHVAGTAGHDSLLANAISDIVTAWNKQDIRTLSRHVHRDTPVAVYLRGKYFYSLSGDNYLSMTRDAFATTKTVSFTLDQVTAKVKGVTTVSGHHTYTDREGKSHTLLVSYTLKTVDDGYYLTRVDTESAKPPAPGPTGVQNRQPINPGPDPASSRPDAHQDIAKRPRVPLALQRSVSTPGDHAYPVDNNALQYRLTGAAWDGYFPSRSVYYQHYYLHYFSGITAPSVYYYYDGTFPPYIGTVSAISQQSQNTYVSYPLYTSNGLYQGELDNANDSQIGHTMFVVATGRDSLLADAIADIVAAWKQHDIRLLSRHIDRDTPVAVMLRGKYFYSLDGGDYQNITRDAFSAIKTVSFTLDRLQHKTRDIYTVNGRHTYIDATGKSHTVLISTVLKKVDDDYYISQVGTAPEKLDR